MLVGCRKDTEHRKIEIARHSTPAGKTFGGNPGELLINLGTEGWLAMLSPYDSPSVLLELALPGVGQPAGQS